jgi:hypothetical protein
MSAVAPLRKPIGLRFGGNAAPVAAPAKPKVRPRLVIVAPPRSAAGRLPFLILIGAVLVSGLLTLLMLHTLAAQDGFKVNTLQTKLNALTDTEQGLAQQVQADSSPAKLRKAAAALGMVPSTIPAYKRVHGRVVGLEQPAYLPSASTATTVSPTVNPKTPPTAAATNVAAGTTSSTTTNPSTTNKTTQTNVTTGTSATTTHHHKRTTQSATNQPTTTQPTNQQPTKHHKPTNAQ